MTFPAALAALSCFVTWVGVPTTRKDGSPKLDKVPYNPLTGRKAKANDPRTWSDLATARHALKQHRHTGIGMMFDATLPYFGIDLDHCRDVTTGTIAPWAQAIITRFASYTEPSPSGTGIHILGTGALPSGGRRRGSIEVYQEGRFFTLTFDPLPGHTELRDCSDVLADWHHETFLQRSPSPAVTGGSTRSIPISDELLRDRCMRNEKFRRLWDGNDADYGNDTSRADLAFCNGIVRHGGDRTQVDTLYRTSGRFRDKWDQRRGDRTYGERTLNEAFDGTIIPFDTSPRLVQPHQDAIILPPDNLPDDVLSLKAEIARLRALVIQVEQQATDRIAVADARTAAAEQRAAIADARAERLSALQSQTMSIVPGRPLAPRP